MNRTKITPAMKREWIAYFVTAMVIAVGNFFLLKSGDDGIISILSVFALLLIRARMKEIAP